MKYTGSNNSAYTLFDKPFAGGGEGEVFNIDGLPNLVAKIYSSSGRTPARRRKLQTMVSIKPNFIDQCAWPVDLLEENGQFAGFVMPRISGRDKLRNIYVYDNRKGRPWSLYVAIAKNLASAVYHVHKINQVIGDLNPENILVDPNTGIVTLIDTDSFHITDATGSVMRCDVGMPEYVAPELQSLHFPTAPLPTFTKETDCFSLAVLIFALLMNGAHPYSCKVISGSASKFDQIDNIVRGICAYFSSSSSPSIQIPRYAPAIDSLPPDLQNLFKRAFVDGHRNLSVRPKAEEWYNALEGLENNLKKCMADPSHIYFYYASQCPWCGVENKMKTLPQTVFTGAVSLRTQQVQTSALPQGSQGTQGSASQYVFTPAVPPNNPMKKNRPGVLITCIVAVVMLFSFGLPLSLSIFANLARHPKQTVPIEDRTTEAGMDTEAGTTEESALPATADPSIATITPSSIMPDNQQKLLVEVYGSSAKISLMQWDTAQGWVTLHEANGSIGRNGISANKSEGDGKTPAGTFRLGFVFGLTKPDTMLDFRPVTKKTIWVDDVNSQYYNTMQQGTVTKDWKSQENTYKQFTSGGMVHCVFIEFNGDGLTANSAVAGQGSAIFLCGRASPRTPTPGDVDIYEDDMLIFLKYLDKSKNPIIEVR